MTPAAVPARFAILSAIIRLLTILSPELSRVPLHRLKNPHGCLSPWINRTRCRKAKRPITDRPYIFVFYRNMKVKKGRRLVRSSVMLKRTAAMVPRVIKAGLSCNWCCVEPVALLATLDLIPPESENHVTRSTGERVTTRGSSRVALHTAKLLYQNRENLQAAVAVPVYVPLCKF